MPTAKMMAVLVLYGREARQSEAFVSLQQAAQVPGMCEHLELLVYDNSAEAHEMPAVPFALRYMHDPANGGLSPAYNSALQLAETHSAEWLLLLDQDTEFAPEFVAELLGFVREMHAEVVAAVPRLLQGGMVLSPRQRPRWSHAQLPQTAAGPLRQRVSAFNSGALLRVSAMRRAGGFPAEYTLDFLDHAIFHELQQRGGRVWLLRSRLEHQLSTHALGESIAPARYARMLRNERRFYAEKGSTADRVWYRLRQVKRLVGLIARRAAWPFVRLETKALLGMRL